VQVYKIHDKLWLGLSGLATDAQTLYEKLVFRCVRACACFPCCLSIEI
jgi:20S proteasome alpha/beta subunit